jgi:predicted Rossmann-fold nucleotide-binding protein
MYVCPLLVQLNLIRPVLYTICVLSTTRILNCSAVGAYMAKHSIQLVYGGGKSGLMGTVSTAVLENGGKVVGIVPYQMVKAGGEKPAGRDQPAWEDNKDVDVGENNPQVGCGH